MKLLLPCALVAASLALDRCGGEEGERLVLPSGEIRVVDGDTVAHGTTSYRLTGFDTPETHRARCAAETALGDRAARRLAQLIGEAGALELTVRARPDRYGRRLARAVAGNQEIGALLIAEGLARPYAGGARQPWCGSGTGGS
ncbi:thermonuclease family protein [Pukyongiella litopenaei]|uniref:Thermonuclease family protein n=1 Tax=Pukyongiella litopenaei TaxID=2605946 RepID=A0A5C2H1U7_9RHOB|nr:thermonuclease family protein [Pukyongiella litopenaei]QEP30428.1 thermonuclease family protein [Pukyongiella litopenaei]